MGPAPGLGKTEVLDKEKWVLGVTLISTCSEVEGLSGAEGWCTEKEPLCTANQHLSQLLSTCPILSSLCSVPPVIPEAFIGVLNCQNLYLVVHYGGRSGA